MRRMFDEALHDLTDTNSLTPYWLNQPLSEYRKKENSVGKITDNKENFAVEINVSQFAPEELDVSLKDRYLVVEGRHEERNDEYGTIERHFIRKYRVPEDTNLDDFQSHLSREGMLSITAPKKALECGRKIPILPE